MNTNMYMGCIIQKNQLLHRVRLITAPQPVLIRKSPKQIKQQKMMVSASDGLPPLFSAKLLTDAHLTRNLPAQQYDLRQNGTACPKSTGNQEECQRHYGYMTYFFTEAASSVNNTAMFKMCSNYYSLLSQQHVM